MIFLRKRYIFYLITIVFQKQEFKLKIDYTSRKTKNNKKKSLLLVYNKSSDLKTLKIKQTALRHLTIIKMSRKDSAKTVPQH